jgi:Flp pilus assembly protein TadD
VNTVWAAAIFSLGLAALYIAGYFFPTGASWGFHFLGFLSPAAVVLFVLAVIAGVAYVHRGWFDAHLSRAEQFATSQPRVFLVISCVIFAAATLFFRVETPLLGDSFLLLRILKNASEGIRELNLSREPLALLYFFTLIKVLGTYDYPQILQAFHLGEVVLGTGFIVSTWLLTAYVFPHKRSRLLAFLFLLMMPYMQLFFGYAEVYAAVLLTISCYLLSVVMYLNGRITLVLVLVLYLLTASVHLLSLFIFLPSTLFLLYHEWRLRGARNIIIGLGAIGIMVAVVLWFADFSMQRLMQFSDRSPYLSIFDTGDKDQPYTLFSPYHFIDVLNLTVFAAPAAIFLLLPALFRNHTRLRATATHTFLLAATVTLFGFIALARFDLPLAIDWDVTAPFFYIVACFAAYVTLSDAGKETTSVFGMILIITCLTSAVWFRVNASAGASIARATVLNDPRFASQEGSFNTTLHLTEYYIRQQDIQNIITLCEQYVARYPLDSRGYLNYTLYLRKFGKQADARIIGIFERWRAADSSSREARTQFSNFHFDIGNRSYREGSYGEAIDNFRKAATLTPGIPDAYNGLGITYRELGRNDSALSYYRKALAADSTSVYAYINLGNLTDEMGNADQAIAWYKKALTLQPNLPQLHYNLGIAYSKRGDAASAMASLRQAARLGDADARALLRERGERW